MADQERAEEAPTELRRLIAIAAATAVRELTPSGAYRIAAGVIAQLGEMNIEERREAMEIMGMEKDTVECDEHYDGRHWTEPSGWPRVL